MKEGNSTFATGARVQRERPFKEVDFSFPYYTLRTHFATRPPILQSNLYALAKTFPGNVWGFTFVTFTFLAITFGIIFATYQRLPREYGLLEGNYTEMPWFDLILLPVVKFLEPEPIPWFPKWSSGRLATLMYSIFCTFILFFMLSNLRTILIARKYEKPMVTEDDVLNRGKGVYIMNEVQEYE